MFLGKAQKILVFILVTLFFTSCSKYSKMVKSINMDAKLEYAIKLYKKEQYYKALPLFEELITVFRGTKKAEQTYYYYSYCNYNLEDFETAAYDFDNFAKTFPTSEFAEECAYMHAYCFYQLSPNYSLDQTSTLKAINELQLFTDVHPRSAKVTECNKHIDELRYKLETKDFENAKLYFHMDDFKAATAAFKNILRDYPSSIYREESMFFVIKSEFLLAENSIDTKKSNRYNAALISFGEFISTYPESKFKKDATGISETCKKKLEKLTSQAN